MIFKIVFDIASEKQVWKNANFLIFFFINKLGIVKLKYFKQLICFMGMKSRDTPLAEITLRKYERPYNIKGRDLISKLCLSVGLLQPGDSRDVVVDVFMALLNNYKKGNRPMTSKEIEDAAIALRKKHNLKVWGVASSNIRRQTKRLRDLYLVDKIANNYRISENETLSNIYKEKVEQFMLNSIRERVGEYFSNVDKEFVREVKMKKEKKQKRAKSKENKSKEKKTKSEFKRSVKSKDQMTFDAF